MFSRLPADSERRAHDPPRFIFRTPRGSSSSFTTTVASDDTIPSASGSPKVL